MAQVKQRNLDRFCQIKASSLQGDRLGRSLPLIKNVDTSGQDGDDHPDTDKGIQTQMVSQSTTALLATFTRNNRRLLLKVNTICPITFMIGFLFFDTTSVK